MTCTAYSGEIVPFRSRKPAAGHAAARRPGLLRRIFDAVFESRMKHAEREIARYFERTGGRMTDDLERRMTQRLMTGDWDVRD
jgi:hypothetical protein